jgi:biopolymer transport protein ExbD
MAGGADMDDEDGITGINVTPLVDVMLVLLIIFMVASNYIVKEAIEVNLPKAATGEELNQENKSIALILKKDGRLFLNGKLATREEIKKASAALSKEKDAQALIAADRGTSHGEVVKLIDLIRQSGLTSFAINIDPDSDPIVDEDVSSAGEQASDEADTAESADAEDGSQGAP